MGTLKGMPGNLYVLRVSGRLTLNQTVVATVHRLSPRRLLGVS